MAAASTIHCISIQNYYHRSMSKFYGGIIWRTINMFSGVQSVTVSPIQNNSSGKKINVLGEAEEAGNKLLSGVEDEQFAESLREAWPYLIAHRGSTFVVVVSAEIVNSPHLDHILMDISMLHGLGINFVLIPETDVETDEILTAKGSKPKYVGSYRVTDSDSLRAAMDASGRICDMIMAKLSRAPSLSGVRRHGDNDSLYDGVIVASGNFLSAKRKGVVEGIDYLSTGVVKKIDVSRMSERLDQNCIVLLGNLGYSSSGEVLNCNTYEVATACAVAIGAQKLICIIDGPILDDSERLIRSLTLQDADELIHKQVKQSETAANYVKAVAKMVPSPNGKAFSQAPKLKKGVGFDNRNGFWSSEQGFAVGGRERLSRSNGYLGELAVAAYVCRGGVERVHLLDGTIDGILLKELFQRDGAGTMIASDLHEGMRQAKAPDPDKIEHNLQTNLALR